VGWGGAEPAFWREKQKKLKKKEKAFWLRSDLLGPKIHKGTVTKVRPGREEEFENWIVSARETSRKIQRRQEWKKN